MRESKTSQAFRAFWNKPVAAKVVVGYCAITDTLLNIFVFVGLTGFVRQMEKDYGGGEKALSNQVIYGIEGVLALLIFARQWSHSYAKAEVVERAWVGEAATGEAQAPLLHPSDPDVEEQQPEPRAGAEDQQPVRYQNAYCYYLVTGGHIFLSALYKAAIPALFQASVHFGTPSLGKVGASTVNALSAPVSFCYLIASFKNPVGIHWGSWNEASRGRRGVSAVAAGIVTAKTGVYYGAYGVLLVPWLKKHSSYGGTGISLLTLVTVASQFPVYLNNFLRRPPQMAGWEGAWHQVGELFEIGLRTAYVYQFSRQSADAVSSNSLILAGANCAIDAGIFLYNSCCLQRAELPAVVHGAAEQEDVSHPGLGAQGNGEEEEGYSSSSEEQLTLPLLQEAKTQQPAPSVVQQENRRRSDDVQQISSGRSSGTFSAGLRLAKSMMTWMVESESAPALSEQNETRSASPESKKLR